MARSSERTAWCALKVLDSADIVGEEPVSVRIVGTRARITIICGSDLRMESRTAPKLTTPAGR